MFKKSSKDSGLGRLNCIFFREMRKSFSGL